jgi:hypothetical protein
MATVVGAGFLIFGALGAVLTYRAIQAGEMWQNAQGQSSVSGMYSGIWFCSGFAALGFVILLLVKRFWRRD